MTSAALLLAPAGARAIDFSAISEVYREDYEGESAYPTTPEVGLITSSGMFGESILGELLKAIQGMDQAGLKIPTMETSVKGPALQVIPIAIFA